MFVFEMTAMIKDRIVQVIRGVRAFNGLSRNKISKTPMKNGVIIAVGLERKAKMKNKNAKALFDRRSFSANTFLIKRIIDSRAKKVKRRSFMPDIHATDSTVIG